MTTHPELIIYMLLGTAVYGAISLFLWFKYAVPWLANPRDPYSVVDVEALGAVIIFEVWFIVMALWAAAPYW